MIDEHTPDMIDRIMGVSLVTTIIYLRSGNVLSNQSLGSSYHKWQQPSVSRN